MDWALGAALPPAAPSLIPFPAGVLPGSGSMYAPGPDTGVRGDGDCAAYLRETLGLPAGSEGIVLEIVPGGAQEEAYTLEARAEGVRITAATEVGLFRGATTLVQLWPHVPSLRIDDAPRYAWRGVRLPRSDVAGAVRFIDLAARYKLNVLVAAAGGEIAAYAASRYMRVVTEPAHGLTPAPDELREAYEWDPGPNALGVEAPPTLPLLAAVAEVGWSSPERDWEAFSTRLASINEHKGTVPLCFLI